MKMYPLGIHWARSRFELPLNLVRMILQTKGFNVELWQENIVFIETVLTVLFVFKTALETTWRC